MTISAESAFSLDPDRLDNSPRCPRCGKRNVAHATQCVSCGYEFIPRRTRVRCAHCGKRIPADEAVCPHCDHDPHASRFPFTLRVIIIFLCAILIACGGWIAFRALNVFVFPGAARADVTPTAAVQIIFVVATVPAPSFTPLPTLTPNATTTPTSRFSPTPTRIGVRASNTPLPSRTPTLAPYSAPRLIAPLNATIYEGAHANIALEWQSVALNGLRENEWYMISVAYTARDGKSATRIGWSKETRWTVIKDWHADISLNARTLSWNVTVMRVDGADPFASLTRAPASPVSAARTIIWK